MVCSDGLGIDGSDDDERHGGAELGRPWRRCYAQQNEGKAGGGRAVLTVRAQGGPVSERERRGRPRSTGITGSRGGRGRGGSDDVVPSGSNGGHRSTWRRTADAYGMLAMQGDDSGREVDAATAAGALGQWG